MDRIVAYLDPRPENVFIEIGAGRGALTGRLAPHVHRLVALEIDSDCLPALRASLMQFSNAHVLQADVLKLDLRRSLDPFLEPGRKVRITGNLPFNIATAIIEKLLQSSLGIEDMTFMVQWEVARRIVASPGSREYGYLSVLCQHYCVAGQGFKVLPGSFYPRPKVISSMVRLAPARRSHSPEWEDDLLRLVKGSFAHRRKTLANSLRMSPHWKDSCDRLLAMASIDGARRAEDLTVEEFERLADSIASL